jgi:hypothetical protein
MAPEPDCRDFFASASQLAVDHAGVRRIHLGTACQGSDSCQKITPLQAFVLVLSIHWQFLLLLSI